MPAATRFRGTMDRFKIWRPSTVDHEPCAKTQTRSSASTSWKKLRRPTGLPGGRPPSSAPTRQPPDVAQKKEHTAFALRDLPKLDISEAASLTQIPSRPSPRASRQVSSSAVRRGCEKVKSNETTIAKSPTHRRTDRANSEEWHGRERCLRSPTPEAQEAVFSMPAERHGGKGGQDGEKGTHIRTKSVPKDQQGKEG